jgi:hypothetical protein
MNDSTAKQQIVEKIKSSSNVLITVSTNPSVDELSAALGLTLLLNKMNKHATAVFSGAIPPAITFLDPQKTFENTVDSLRDFIIALDKEKADHLRYKVDGDVVKIFITPYRTTISGDDLEFSQGDYNVELVLALGVKNQDSLDTALAAHGRILHDAIVVTISMGDEKSELGSLDWREQNASSLSEMLVNLSDSFKSDKKLVDEQIATAFLTGIVAATDRFSNNRTSSRVMTTAAQLMAAGANQQLIASKLEEANEIRSESSKEARANSDGTTDLSEGKSTKLEKKTQEKEPSLPPTPKEDDGSLVVTHEKLGDLDQVAKETAAENEKEATIVAQEELAKRQVKDAAKVEQAPEPQQSEPASVSQLPPVSKADTPSVADLQKDLAAASADITEASEQPVSNATPIGAIAGGDNTWQDSNQAPSMGGTLNATTEQAAEDTRRQIEDDRNRTILSHNGSEYVGDRGDSTPSFQSPLNSSTQPSTEEPPVVDPFVQPPVEVSMTQPPATYAQPATTLAEIDQQNRVPHEDARAAVDAAFGAVPFTPAVNSDFGAVPQPLGELTPHNEGQTNGGFPPLPDFSTLPPLPAAPQFSGPSGALPPEKLEDMLTPVAPIAAPVSQSTDPGQFKIPGQP